MFWSLTGVEALFLAGAGAALGAALAVHFGGWSSAGARAAGSLAAALAASALAVAPVTAWAIVSDLRDAQQLSARQAERIGPEENGVDTSLVDGVALLVPRRATYFATFSDRVDPDRASVFRVWSLSALLPRKAVADLSSAEWIVSWGVLPSELGVPVTDLRVIEPRRHADPPVYVARIVR